jgi:hypothetical protein
MLELLLPSGFDTQEYSWVKATIGINTLVDYSVAKKHQHSSIGSMGWTRLKPRGTRAVSA